MTSADGEVVCSLCAHTCHIAPGELGICQVRANTAGRPALPFFSKVSALHVDPVEKKPLYHFHPGARLLSIGFLGCNFRCPFCQNYSISQSTRAASQTLPPADLAALAVENDVLGVAYTYNEPTVHFEYLLAACEHVAAARMANTLVTNGHLTRRPARELLERIDAVNVDLKSFSTEFYEHELGGRLDAVLDFIAIAAELSSIEVTTLLIPGRNDSPEEIESIARFVASLDPRIPLHLSGYYPTYKYSVEATSVAAIREACDIARRHLHHVYPGNVPGDSTTRCHSCGAPLVERRGYSPRIVGLSDDRCSNCGAPAPIRWFTTAAES